ncbi:hypothetical protein BDW74DRAFT_164743 [Aspergillus multicolor]|uniref:uncharacterized protein n=1 Tax=Aspergillus multicolor TaxID=41759 RepID=UPI003CCDB44D
MRRSPATRPWCYMHNIKASLGQHSIQFLEIHSYHTLDWNSNHDSFKFTRGRFVVNETQNLRQREIRYDMNRLAKVAADSVGAARCIAIKKYPDGMFNKAFLMSMDDGQEAVAKVPSPNAGVPYFTTASEVATMDFARNILDTPVPLHRVGAEFIIMEKIQGVSLSDVWGTIALQQKLRVLVAMTTLQKRWLGFAIGPATGRAWCDAGRSSLGVEKGPSIGTRETKPFQSLEPPKTTALFCGPKLNQPDEEKKLIALAKYQQIVDALIPTNPAITKPTLWHNDLHDDNIFRLDLAPRPSLSGLSPAERTAAMQAYSTQNTPAYGLLVLAYRMFEYGEAHFCSLLVDLKDTWAGLPTANGAPFPFAFSVSDVERIKLDCEGAVAGTELVVQDKEQLGDLWPDKGFIEHERYEECRAALREVKDMILDELEENEEERAEYGRCWPFD